VVNGQLFEFNQLESPKINNSPRILWMRTQSKHKKTSRENFLCARVLHTGADAVAAARMHKIEIDLGDRKQTSVCLMLTSNAPAAK